MAEIDGGALSFKSVMDNDQINTAIEETLRRVQGLSDGTVAGGKKMDAAFDATADSIRSALGQIGTACEMHEKELQNLESEYQRLGQKASAAFMQGRDKEYEAINKQQAAVKGEITVRERLLSELREQSNALEQEAEKIEENKRKTEQNAGAQSMLRTQLMNAKNALAEMEEAGLRGTKQFSDMQKEVGRLQNAMGDANTQAKILSNDYGKLQAVTESVGGIVGAFSVAQGAVGLFAGENENLQKIMTKVQSLMVISIGLQQVMNVLNKDSYTQVVLVGGVKEWWAGIVTKATVAETAETIATTANTAAQTANATATGVATTSQAANTVATGGQAVAAKVGTIANIGLAGAFRLVGVAIKSIPVFGWIITGITALVGLVAALTSESRKAAKETKEMNAAIVEGSYKAIGSVQNLSSQWSALGDNLDEKKKFIEQNKKAFDELGVSIMDVADAEKLLADGAQAFIDAQIAKAKAAAVLANSEKWVKQSVEADLELEQAKKTPKVTRYVSGGQFGGGYSYEIDNPAIKKAEYKQKEANEKLQGLYADAAKYTADGLKKMEEVGIDGQDKITEGTVAWYEKQISDKQAYLKTLSVLDDTEIKTTQKQIDDFQKIIDKATGKKTTGSSSNSPKDPFLEKLEKQKAEYTRFMKWINSGDQIIAKAASKEFAGLLKQGSSYIDYLKNQREQILAVDVANRSKAQNKQLRTLNDQIAEETKKTVLEAFNNELSDQLTNAKTVMEMLNIIAQKRKALANDNTEVDNSKKDTLDEAEKTALQKQKEETDSLLEEYASYLDKKIKLEMDYNNDITLLEKRRSQATTDADKEKITQAIANRTKQYKKDTKGTGDADYDAMVEQYKNYQQRIASISADYDAKIALATKNNNADLVAELQKDKEAALNDTADKELKNSDLYIELLKSTSEVGYNAVKQVNDKAKGILESAVEGIGANGKKEYTIVIDTVDGNGNPIKQSLKLSESAFNEFKEKVTQNDNFLNENNPFKTLIGAIKKYNAAAGDAAKKDALKDMFKSASSSIDMVKGTFDSVVGGLDKMGITADEQTSQVLNDIGGMMEGASQLATGIATGNPLSIIQGGIGLLTSAFDLFNSKDRKAERQIKKHAEAIGELERAYNALSWAIDKALGSEVYKNQKAAIDNMKQQQYHLLEMQRNERDKKKTDNGKIKEWQSQYEELGRQIEDMLESISNDILQTDAKTFANELGDALVSAFAKGESAADAFGETVDNVIKQAVLNQLKKNFLENQLQGALDNLYKSMGGKDDGSFSFDGLTDAEIAAFKAQVSRVTTGFNQALGEYAKIFEDIEVPEDPDTSLTGSVKGVSEETASLIGGQMNAMRINQLEATAILRQQLAALSVIANNTSYNYHLAKLERIVSLLEAQSGNSLRSQGLS